MFGAKRQGFTLKNFFENHEYFEEYEKKAKKFFGFEKITNFATRKKTTIFKIIFSSLAQLVRVPHVRD